MSQSTTDPQQWTVRAPGNLADELPAIETSLLGPAIAAAASAARDWAATSIDDRKNALRACRRDLEANAESLAQLIAREVGKPLTEARGEIGAVIAKFDLTFDDADRWISERDIGDGPHPAHIRFRPRGPAAVIAPFNFPVHLGHGATVAYLLAGNPVLFKPSPLAAHVGARYAEIMEAHLPVGVMQVVQGWTQTSRALALHPAIRSVCFTGSVTAGRQLARELSEDFSKSLALELGGKNATFVLADADLGAAATAVADSFCLTAGQRCNATSVVFVDVGVVDSFLDALVDSVARYQPGDPLDPETRLGPLVSAAAVDRYRSLISDRFGTAVLPGSVPDQVGGMSGHYVKPAIIRCGGPSELVTSRLFRDEAFAPILVICPMQQLGDALAAEEQSPYGLSAAIFTKDESIFREIVDALHIGNVYWNLPTTFSPSTLPFGGLGASGNGKPGGRGFIRFAADEQAIQKNPV